MGTNKDDKLFFGYVSPKTRKNKTGKIFEFPQKCCICLGIPDDSEIISHEVSEKGPSMDIMKPAQKAIWSTTYEVEVPVCSQCKDKKDRRQKLYRRIFRISYIALFILIPWLANSLITNEDAVEAKNALFFFIFFPALVLFFVVPFYIRIRVAKFSDDGSLKFTNAEYNYMFKRLSE